MTAQEIAKLVDEFFDVGGDVVIDEELTGEVALSLFKKAAEALKAAAKKAQES